MKIRIISVVLVMLMAGLLWGDSFTVESRNGVPFITRNGVPVPARMFWGNVYG